MSVTDLNLGPLTTTFTAPAACDSLTVSAAGSSSYVPYKYPRLFSSIANSCFPSGYPLGNAALTSTFSQYSYQDQHVYFSPGLCPSSWLKNTIGSTGAEITAFCCPPGFSPRKTPAVQGGSYSTFCVSSVDSTVITTVAYTGNGVVAGKGLTRIFTFSENIMPAGAIWIRYKDSDFPSSGSTTTGSSSSSSSTSIATSSQNSATSSPSSGPTSSPSGIPTGAKIGLALGIPLVIILAASIFAFIFIRRRRRRRNRFVGGVGGATEEGDVIEPELIPSYTTELSSRAMERPKSELPGDGMGVHLLQSWVHRSEGRYELDSRPPTNFAESELPG